MSRHHSIQASEANSRTYDIAHMSAHDLTAMYGIEFIEDPDSKEGTVFDPVMNKEFDSVLEWAEEQRQLDHWADLAAEQEEEFGYYDE